MRRVHGIIRGIVLGAFIGLFLGEGIASFLKQIFGLELGAVGCPGALIGMGVGVLSNFIVPIRVFFNYISVVFLAIFFVWLFGRIGFLSGEYLGTIILGDIGHRIGGAAGMTMGIIFAIIVTVLNGIILIGRSRTPFDEL